mmetsp:Transcript_30205/g.67008  ORF Transcript_30205/g.67008 Transcript_30205/m.67008 type:complete len:217 (-) Transcript_30205:458-1108(-)
MLSCPPRFRALTGALMTLVWPAARPAGAGSPRLRAVCCSSRGAAPAAGLMGSSLIVSIRGVSDGLRTTMLPASLDNFLIRGLPSTKLSSPPSVSLLMTCTLPAAPPGACSCAAGPATVPAGARSGLVEGAREEGAGEAASPWGLGPPEERPLRSEPAASEACPISAARPTPLPLRMMRAPGPMCTCCCCCCCLLPCCSRLLPAAVMTGRAAASCCC